MRRLGVGILAFACVVAVFGLGVVVYALARGAWIAAATGALCLVPTAAVIRDQYVSVRDNWNRMDEEDGL